MWWRRFYFALERENEEYEKYGNYENMEVYCKTVVAESYSRILTFSFCSNDDVYILGLAVLYVVGVVLYVTAQNASLQPIVYLRKCVRV